MLRSSSDDAHLKPLRAVLARDLLDGANLIVDRDLAGAVELEEQRRRQRIVGLRVRVDDAELRFVDDLDARDRDAELNGLDHGVGGALHRLERAHRGADRFGPAVQAQASVR